MEGIEEYTLLSKEILSDKDLDKICGVVRGAGVGWDGDRNYAEKNPQGNYEYTLTCTRLTEKNKAQLRTLGLDLTFIFIPDDAPVRKLEEL